MTKLCIDCSHYKLLQKTEQMFMGIIEGYREIQSGTLHLCNAQVSLVTGEPITNDCDMMRYRGSCGPEGKLFENKQA